MKLKTMMNTMVGARVPIARKGNNFVVEINIDKKEDGYIVPKKVAARRWSGGSRNIGVDEGKVRTRNLYGALTVEDEHAYEEAYQC